MQTMLSYHHYISVLPIQSQANVQDSQYKTHYEIMCFQMLKGHSHLAANAHSYVVYMLSLAFLNACFAC